MRPSSGWEWTKDHAYYVAVLVNFGPIEPLVGSPNLKASLGFAIKRDVRAKEEGVRYHRNFRHGSPDQRDYGFDRHSVCDGEGH